MTVLPDESDPIDATGSKLLIDATGSHLVPVGVSASSFTPDDLLSFDGLKAGLQRKLDDLAEELAGLLAERAALNGRVKNVREAIDGYSRLLRATNGPTRRTRKPAP